MFLAEITLSLGFWLFVLFSDRRVFLMSISALVFEVGFLDVRVHQFGKLFLSHVFFFFFFGGGVSCCFSAIT